jgi:hypothetical protein
VAGLAARIENVGHKLYMNNILHTKTTNCCGTVKNGCFRILERI